jgi:hypothetical protein
MDKDLTLEIITPFVPIPTVLIDQIMPTLKDTEWRLLIVIGRQTLGWGTTGRTRKAKDWLSQRQLMARTGRNSAALSAALDTLVKRQLVSASDQNGYPLSTPEERRRYRGRMFLGLNRETLKRLQEEPAKKQLPLRVAETMQPEKPAEWTSARTSGWSKADLIVDSRMRRTE